MRATVFPGRPQGTVRVPASKSMAHRAVICAALADGTSVLTNVSLSNDIRATIAGMRSLGADILVEESEGQAARLTVKGVGRPQAAAPLVVDCGESGSTLRFFIPIFALSGQPVRFECGGRLAERPQTVYQQLFAAIGTELAAVGGGWQLNGGIFSGEYELQGDVSSQFISGLLFALPLLEGDSLLHILPPFESRSYVLLTLSMLAKFGVRAEWRDDNTLFIPGCQRYLPCDLAVEGDFSQLAFFAVLGALSGEVSLLGVDVDSLQGDRRIIDIVRLMGGDVEQRADGYICRPGRLHSAAVDMADCPDLGPVLCVLAACAEGESELYNAGRLRIKESDRIADVEQELVRCGVRMHSTEDTMYISGGGDYPGGVECLGHNDHRIVMALAVLATVCRRPLTICGAQAINKSYPRFFDDLQQLGIKVVLQDD